MATVHLQIENMHCGACVRRVTQTINAVPGNHASAVQVGAASVSTASDDTADLLRSLAQAGFPAQVASTQP